MVRTRYIQVYHVTDEMNPLCRACGYQFDLQDQVYQAEDQDGSIYCSRMCANQCGVA